MNYTIRMGLLFLKRNSIEECSTFTKHAYLFLPVIYRSENRVKIIFLRGILERLRFVSWRDVRGNLDPATGRTNR